MGKESNRQFLRHVLNVATASGKKRVTYAVVNILMMALACAFAYAIYRLFGGLDAAMEESIAIFLLSWVGIIVCAIAVVIFFVEGVVAQIVSVVCSSIGIADREERKYSVAALIISLASIAIVAVAFALLVLLT